MAAEETMAELLVEDEVDVAAEEVEAAVEDMKAEEARAAVDLQDTKMSSKSRRQLKILPKKFRKLQ